MSKVVTFFQNLFINLDIDISCMSDSYIHDFASKYISKKTDGCECIHVFLIVICTFGNC